MAACHRISPNYQEWATSNGVVNNSYEPSLTGVTGFEALGGSPTQCSFDV